MKSNRSSVRPHDAQPNSDLNIRGRGEGGGGSRHSDSEIRGGEGWSTKFFFQFSLKIMGAPPWAPPLGLPLQRKKKAVTQPLHIRSSSDDVFERRKSTGSGLFPFLGNVIAKLFRQIVCISVTKHGKTYVLASSHIKQ